jgi:hypothetical protein
VAAVRGSVRETGVEQSSKPDSEATREEPRTPEGTRSWQWLGALLGVSLLFAVVVTTINSIDVADTPRCDDQEALAEERADAQGEEIECYDGGSARKTATIAIGFATGVFGLVAAVLAFWGIPSGTMSRALLPLTIVTLVLGALTMALNA